MNARQRVDAQPGFLLHAYPYSETSLVVDIFSRDYGRLPLLARGARRPRSGLRGLLTGFQPLELGWFGSGEVRTLAKVEWLGGFPLLSGRALLIGYYLNELIIRLLPREDPHPALYESYVAALSALSSGGEDAPELRKFEIRLLRELGYGLRLAADALTGEAIDPHARYAYQLDRGPLRQVGAGGTALDDTVAGKTLLDMGAEDYRDAVTRRESRRIMRQLISHYLEGRALESRRVFMELQEL